MLSSVGTRLGEESTIQVLDVEAELIASLSADDRKSARKRRAAGAADIDMASVARAFPREKVLRLWSEALSKLLNEPLEGRDWVIVCHLTLYRNDRSEFYSTAGLLTAAILGAGLTIDEVVLLIDDVYDMYVRLSQEFGALNAQDRITRWMDFTTKSTPKQVWGRLNADGGTEVEHVSLETSVQTINLLVGWRRQESISAEALAGATGARLTVLGIKHSYTSLLKLVSPTDGHARRIYISHPISAYRRSINTLLGAGQHVTEGSWEQGVAECNRIPALLETNSSLVAIMPTAIDELRFRGLEKDSIRLTERSPTLGPRWPLMNHGVGLVAGGASGAVLSHDSVQHQELLIAEKSAIRDQQFTGELTRFVEGLMFIEIPYRDHLIVANTDGFLVFRPLSDRARVSSGVEHEVMHWWDKVEVGASKSRLAILHTTEDLALLKTRWEGTGFWFEGSEGLRAVAVTIEGIRAGAGAFLAEDYDLRLAEAESVLDGNTLAVEHLGGRPEFASEHGVGSVRREALIKGVAEFIRLQLDLSRGKISHQVKIFLLEKDVVLSERRVGPIQEFLKGGPPGGQGTEIAVIEDESVDENGGDILSAVPVLREVFGVDTKAERDDLDLHLGHSASKAEERTRFAELGRNHAIAWFESLIRMSEQKP